MSQLNHHMNLSLDENQLNSFRSNLGDSLTSSALLEPDSSLERYHSDWSSFSSVLAPVLRPKSTSETAEIVRAVSKADAGIRIAVQGGMTGLVGAALPQKNEIVLSMERLNSITIDPVTQTAQVGAGVTLQALNEAAAEHGLAFPVDMGSRGSAQIGGMIAVNAGGNRVLQYGMTRQSVLGLEVVLANGEVISNLSPLIKNNTGYDLKHLFVGSEGTLGIITQACLSLKPIPKSRRIALATCSTFDSVVSLLNDLRNSLGSGLTAFEVMWSDYLEDAFSLPSCPALGFSKVPEIAVLVEVSSSSDQIGENALVEAISPWMENTENSDVVISQSDKQADRLWELRDLTGEAALKIAPYAGFDVTVPLDVMSRWKANLDAALESYQLTKIQTYGHLGDGNLHLVIGLDGQDPEAKSKAESAVYFTLAQFGGSVSAEHGIGMAKKKWLPLSRSETEISVMRTIKNSLDPQNILNPGRVFNMEKSK